MKKLINLWLPPLVWAGVIFAFSSMSFTPVNQFYWHDFVVKKSAHIVEYAILTALLYRGFRVSGFTKKRAAGISIVMAILYGFSDEFHQSFTPGREPKVRDVLFDTIGSVLAIYLIWKSLPKAPKKLKIWAKKLQLI